MFGDKMQSSFSVWIWCTIGFLLLLSGTLTCIHVYKKKKCDFALLCQITLKEIRAQSYNASVYHVPPHDGPSLVMTKYSSPHFSCECVTPAHWERINGAETPRPLSSLSGQIDAVSKELFAAIVLVFPNISQEGLQRLAFLFSLSDEQEARNGAQMHCLIHVTHKNCVRSKEWTFSEDDVRVWELGSRFHVMLPHAAPQ